MPKISKTYPAPYNGISEQNTELVLDVQCKDMVNCIPDVVSGVQRRNGTKYRAVFPTTFRPFHDYDRGEGGEQYILGLDSTNLAIYDLDGVSKSVAYINEADVKDYLGTDTSVLKAITVQDRTFILNTSKVTSLATVAATNVNYDKVAYYWLSRASNDSNNEYRYAVYLNGVTYQTTDKTSDVACTELASAINAGGVFTAVARGSLLKITKGTSDFTFSYWDSWGSQASFGWKGSVSKLSELPREIPISGDNPIVRITGNDTSEFTDYFVQWNGDTWEETYDPLDTRGTMLDMPIRVDRLSDGTFEVALLDWETPNIGNADTNPTPSFIGKTISEMFFYKNRIGFTSGDNIVLSQLGSYYNFYSRTALEVLDTDPIDITISSSKASKIYDVTPFQGQLYMLTADEQFTIEQQGTFGPLTVSVAPVSAYSVDKDIEPVVVGDSMFFLSLTDINSRQLREYKIDKNSLTNIGTNVSISTPSLLPKISSMVASAGNSSVFLLDNDYHNRIYYYRITKNGEETIQSSWSKLKFSFNIRYMFIVRDVLYIVTEDNNLLSMSLLPTDTTKIDEVALDTTATFSSYITLHKWLPKISDNVKSYLNPIQITRINFYAVGKFNVDIFRESYNYTYTRTYDSGSTRDMSASVTSKNTDVEITIKSSDDSNFVISSLIYEGFYKQSAREIK